ncbi:hypothetical protein H0H93_007915 [Arthromyces matolae]|nr:hypothetical protein H0H93_007915 [Arthromyces matolae]
MTGASYPYVQFGKPTMATYNFAETVLTERIKQVYRGMDSLPSIYMVGDNPESGIHTFQKFLQFLIIVHVCGVADVAGANAAGWSSILVHTGVYDPQEGPPSQPPTHIATDVESAVKWAIDREFARGV